VSLQTQTITMFVMFGSGFLLGAILDTYQALRIRLRLKGWTVSLIDLLYWFVSAGLVFRLLMWSNWGQLRFYIFIAILAGLFCYYRWLSRVFQRLIRGLIYGIEILLGWIWSLTQHLILNPLKLIYQFITKLTLSILKILMLPIGWIFKTVHRLILPYRKRIHQVVNKWRKKK
jgi:spore cortex biosynthesis protein YabQ